MPNRPKKGRNSTWSWFDTALRNSEAVALTGRIDQLRDDSSAYITVVRSKRDADAPGTVVAITPAAKQALNVIRLAGIGGDEKVLGLSE